MYRHEVAASQGALQSFGPPRGLGFRVNSLDLGFRRFDGCYKIFQGPLRISFPHVPC